jgi:excisionase family DNA binding protein
MNAVATTNRIPGYIGLVEAAKIIGVSHSQVWRYISNGLLDAIEIGGTYLVKQADAKRFRRPKPGRKPAALATQR